jgi:ATP-binding cassette subfamily F protein uup
MIPYLQVEKLTKSFGDLVLFEDINFGVAKDSKVAIIAKNGAGKTTLLNIIAGLDSPDSGTVTFKNNIKIAYLRQEPILDEDKSVMEFVLDSADDISIAIKEYENAIISGDEHILENAINQMDSLQAWDYEAKIKIILSKLKIYDLDKKISKFSGGQKKRIAIANVLAKEPDFLILDEPTNHLDVEIIEWLEEYLSKNRITLLMVTHDRYFLDRVCNEIIEIDNNTVYRYNGNYSYYVQKRIERIELSNKNIDKARNLLRKEAEWIHRMPKARGTKAKYRIENFNKLSEKAKPKNIEKNIQIDIISQRIGKKILELKNVSKSFGNKKILENFTYSFVNGEKIGIIGNNGTGKTTFLNLLTEQIQADSGIIEKGQTIVFGYYKQSGINFDSKQKVIDIIQEIADVITLGSGKQLSASQFLEYFLFPANMQQQPVEKLSGGERKRLYLMTILMKNPNFLILDEPTNDLDIKTLNVLEDFLLGFKGCVLIVSHDRYFMDKVVDSLFVFEGNAKIKYFVGKYTEYYFYKKTIEKEQKKSTKEPKQKKTKNKNKNSNKLSFKEKRLLEQLENDIDQLQKEKIQIEKILNSGKLNHLEIAEKAEKLEKIIKNLDEKEMQWLELSEKED